MLLCVSGDDGGVDVGGQYDVCGAMYAGLCAGCFDGHLCGVCGCCGMATDICVCMFGLLCAMHVCEMGGVRCVICRQHDTIVDNDYVNETKNEHTKHTMQ